MHEIEQLAPVAADQFVLAAEQIEYRQQCLAAGIIAERAVPPDDLHEGLHRGLVVTREHLHGAKPVAAFEIVGCGLQALFQRGPVAGGACDGGKVQQGTQPCAVGFIAYIARQCRVAGLRSIQSAGCEIQLDQIQCCAGVRRIPDADTLELLDGGCGVTLAMLFQRGLTL